MGALFDYMRQTQRFIHDARMEMVDPGDLIDYANRARREVAMRAQCLRVLTPVSGSIVSIQVTNQGSGYTDPTVTITPPDFPSGLAPYPNGAQATATATVLGGKIVSINMEFGGSGYFMPQVSISDPTGSGFEGQIALTTMNTSQGGQEVYPFSGIDLAAFPGVGAIFMVKSISILYSNYRYSLPMYSFSTYQAQIRQYPFQYQYVPTIGSQFGQGTSGSVYLYPLASTQYQMEWDCFCLPSDLIDDQSFEAVPQPWTEAVPHFMAYLAFLELQNMNSARLHLSLFDQFMTRYGAYARPGRITNPYGRY